MGLNPLTIADVKFPEGKQPTLRVCNWGSRSTAFLVDVLTREGLERKEITSTSDRSHAYTDFRLSQLPMAVIARTTDALCRRGHLYVRADLRMGGVPFLEFFHGYLAYDQDLVWPPGKYEAMTEGPGLLRSVAGTDPAAGAEISETVPTNARWRLRAMAFTLVTDATVATRRIHIVIDDGATTLLALGSNFTQAASITQPYQAFPPGSEAHSCTTVGSPILLPPDLMLFQGWRIGTSTVNLQAGDDYGAPQLLVEEWIEE